MTIPLFGGQREAEWKRVQDAISKGLPQTAITNLEPIIAGALKDKAYAEAVKAIGQKIVLEGNIQGNKPEEKIVRLQAEIAKAPKEIVPMLDTLLAHWYWHYFQQNRWRFMQRTATATQPGKDFTTWDLPRLFVEIDHQFQNALTAQATLKTVPVGAWDALLQKGTMPDSYRPTLYDFIAQEALGFYSSGEQAGAKPEDAFELGVDAILPGVPSPFAPADQFTASALENRPVTAAQAARLEAMRASPAGKAYFLYQDLLRFHQADPAPRPAYAAVDLDRLTWAWNTAFGEEKNARYRTALEDFVKAYGDFEIATLAIERQARLAQLEGDLVAAHTIASRGASLFPESPGGKLCRNLIAELETKTASIETERIWNAPWPKITVTYRNVEAAYFRAIAYDWEVFLQKDHHRPESLSEQERRQILSKTPALEWSEQLPPTTDYKDTSRAFTAPDKLKPGFYFIAASHDRAFSETGNIISLATVWVSDLALITRSRVGNIEGFVLSAQSGEPIQGAEVNSWYLDQGGNRVPAPALTTDADGFFSFKPVQGRNYLLRARYQGQEVATANDIGAYGMADPSDPRPAVQTVFFTDRAIYRPGQTIQFKGICLSSDQSKDSYEVLKGEEVTVVFRDPNGKEIARQKARANDYGSFAGSFTAPRDRLMGQMTLRAEGRARGQAWVRVEEYKRPKFEVTLEAPKQAAKLNEKVNLTGRAMSYTGAAVDNAEVRYHVVREVRMPWWWGWWRGGWPGNERQEMAHGTTRTASDGSFSLEFNARPDLKVPEKDEPSFVFHLTADVTDSAGETRSADRSIRVGYTALEATLSANNWLVESEPVEVVVEAKTLDGEPQVAEGRVRVYDLKSPDEPQRAPLTARPYWGFRGRGLGQIDEGSKADDSSDPNNWPLGKVVNESGFTTDTNGQTRVSFKLPAGAFRAVLETQDRFGKTVSGKLPLQILNPAATRLALKIPHLVTAPDWTAQPGEEFFALWGTGYESGRAFVEIEHRNKLIQRFWTKPGQTQQQVKVAVTEAMRGGFTVHVTQVRENRAYLDSNKIDVPWTNKELDLKWEHFVSKLEPGQKETWTAVIAKHPSAHSGDKKEAAASAGGPERLVAEMVAALYDESLDAFAPHRWLQRFDIFRQDNSNLYAQFVNQPENFQYVFGGWPQSSQYVLITYRTFPPELSENLWGFGWLISRGTPTPGSRKAMVGVAQESMPDADGVMNFAATPVAKAGAMGATLGKDIPTPGSRGDKPPAPKLDLGQVTARKTLNETAFFFPQLTSDTNGLVRMTFTMPEALTKWHFLGFAHDTSLRSGFLDGHTVTAKELMVQPNPPRFLREGDTVEFTVKISNQSTQTLSGQVKLTFSDALGGQSRNAELQVKPVTASTSAAETDQGFNIPAKESRTVAWRLTVPDGCGFLTYKVVGASAKLSDGEEGAIPVLARRILVTESLPLPIRGPGTRKFEFTKLMKSGGSKTLENRSLSVQMVSNPAWYAVLALPYLMEYPYECTEQTFNRFYANALARSIATGDPKIHRVFEQWRNTPALDSPLEKNQDLKSVALEETPWLRQAQAESQARRNVGILFDDNRLNYEIDRALQKLKEQQLGDGAWPWFPGGRANDYITLYITTGFGRLRHLGVDVNVQPAIRSLQRLDNWITVNYQRILKSSNPQDYVPSATDALFLYGRSFFLKDDPIAPANKPAIDFFLGESRKFWLQTNCRQTQAQLALALHRFSGVLGLNDRTPTAILASLKERSVSNEEMGMFWRDAELSWWWYRAPIETQAVMIEAFDEVTKDQKAVEDCKVWLLKQKQTQDWKTTKATADAVYALLLRGRDLLSSEALVEVKLDGIDVTPKPVQARPTKSPTPTQPEAGTGFYEVRFAPADIKPKLGLITVTKRDQGVAWGSVNWQYLEDMSKVTPYEGTPLKLKKALFTKTATGRGPVLEPLKGTVQVGDELVVRVELRVDRDMEYIHLKDQRGSGTEPVNVLSQYKYQDGLGYYESTRDTASHFFIDYLPKGTYVFEYSTRVQLRGQYQTGVAEIQCMYAPEFNSHSESIGLTVK
jgi:uncharacterized protein YfaS (alpha-2-macroglobulin family)